MENDLKEFAGPFLESEGHDPKKVNIEMVESDGSKRAFRRISIPSEGCSFIVVMNPSSGTFAKRENRAYLRIGKHLKSRGVPVPEILKFDLGQGIFIVEDLGRESLQSIVLKNKDPLPLYEKVIRSLIRMQVQGAEGFEPAWCSQTGRYDMTVKMRHEAHYFRDKFLRLYLGLKVVPAELEPCFLHLAEAATGSYESFFLHRDFQSRNIMINRGRVGIVDWQGGRLGPLGYDLASIVIDPYTALDLSQREKIYQAYLDIVLSYHTEWADSLKRHYPYLSILRNLQILGAFSFLTKEMAKPQFHKYIPGALDGLRTLLSEMKDPQLSVLRSLVSDL